VNELTTVHLVRHGEVDNPSGVLYGCLPGFILSAEGRSMAQAAATELSSRDVFLVWSSPLERAVETAEPIAAAHGLDVTTDERLIEPWNAFEGLTFGVGDGSLLRPSHWPQLRNPLRPSWGEPYADIAARMRSALDDARSKAAGREAVLVSHQLPIWVVRRSLEGRRLWHRPDRRMCALASVTSVVYRGDDLLRIEYREPAGAAGRQRTKSA
jgi:broad specificity phosphatase PhoE